MPEEASDTRQAVDVRLLGGFSIRIGGAPAHLPVPTRRLVALLAIDGGDVPRSTAGGTLWPEVGHDRALANLRTALWRLHAVAPTLVQTVGTDLRIDPDVPIDLHRSRGLADRLLDVETGSCIRREEVDELASDLLPDMDGEWIVFERERFRDLRTHALERLSELLSLRGEHADAVRCGLLAIEAEPLRESAHRAVMRAYIAEGNPAQALAQYQALERRLEIELQVVPSRTTAELAQGLRVRRGSVDASDGAAFSVAG